jgi:hypothetical protein
MGLGARHDLEFTRGGRLGEGARRLQRVAVASCYVASVDRRWYCTHVGMLSLDRVSLG